MHFTPICCNSLILTVKQFDRCLSKVVGWTSAFNFKHIFFNPFLWVAFVFGAFNVNVWAATSESLSFKVTSGNPHRLKIITSGLRALQEHLRLIESAHSSIEVETFNIRDDLSGGLVFESLMRKSSQGVKVRILADGQNAKSFNPDLIRKLKASGVEVRMFGSHTDVLHWGELFHPHNHRKFLIVDDEKILSGGRNINDDNFQLAPPKMRMDYTYVLAGPLAKDVRLTFDVFWNLGNLTEPKVSTASQPWTLSPKHIQLRKQLNDPSSDQPPEFNLHKVYFISDNPTSNHREFEDEYIRRMSRAQFSFDCETPDFMPAQRMWDAFSFMLDRKVFVHVMVGGLYHGFEKTILNFGDQFLGGRPNAIQELYKKGARFSSLDGKFAQESSPLFFSESQKDWQFYSHAKTAIFDDSDVLFSSFNMEALSENLNFEAGFYFDAAPEVAIYLRKLMKQRTYQSLSR